MLSQPIFQTALDYLERLKFHKYLLKYVTSAELSVVTIALPCLLRVIILSQSELNTKRLKDEEGKVVVVKELRASVSGGQPGDVITAAKPLSLIEHLRENHKSVDPDYTEVRE